MIAIADETITAIHTYFAGERAELSWLLVFCVLLLVTSAVLWWQGDVYARGLAVGLLITALVGSSVSIPLLIRDRGTEKRLTAAPERAALIAEKARMDIVVSKYAVYRYVLVALCGLALAAIVFRPHGFMAGLSTGILILAITVFIVDHYSEQRARRYVSALSEV
jgi:hypothetical protein